MNLMTRAAGAIAALSMAAIPVGALTIKNTSGSDVSVGVDNGSVEAVYTVRAGGSVDVKEDCSAECAVTGPWGYSRLVDQNATLETDGAPLVTAGVGTPARALVPQNPVLEPAAAEAAAPAAAEPPRAQPAKKRAVKARRPVRQAKKGPLPGSFQQLFQGK